MTVRIPLRLVAALTVSLIVAAPALVALAPPAGAVGTCSSSNSGNFFAGYLGYTTPPASWAQTPEGASGYIDTRPGHVCSNYVYPYTFDTAWVMVAYQSGNQYAQSGYMYDGRPGHLCNEYFTEYFLNDGTNFHRSLSDGCAPDNQRHPYYVQYTGSAGPYPPCCGAMRLNAYGLITVAPFDPWQRSWSFDPQYFGEVDHTANDVPGSLSAPAYFSGMGIQSVSSGTFVPVPCYLQKAVDTTRYHATATACDDTAVWTDPQ